MTLYSPSFTSNPRKALKALYSSPNADFALECYLAILADAAGRRRPLADTVNCENSRLIKRKTEKGAGSVRKVMVAEQNLAIGNVQAFLNQCFDPSLSVNHVVIDSWNTLRDFGNVCMDVSSKRSNFVNGFSKKTT